MSHEVRGGSFKGIAYYNLSNGESGSANMAGTLTGLNPSKDEVRNRVSNLTYSVVMFLRTGLKQFNSNGRPFRSIGFGAGGVELPNAEQLWHWQKNVDLAELDLVAAFAESAKYPETMRNNGFAKLPDFTQDEVKLQALQNLVGQTYFVPRRNGQGWKPMSKRLSFADDVVKLENEIKSGNPPADW
jgi:hypothetical protein